MIKQYKIIAYYKHNKFVYSGLILITKEGQEIDVIYGLIKNKYISKLYGRMEKFTIKLLDLDEEDRND